MKLARDGKTMLEDDAEDTTVAPEGQETEETTETEETSTTSETEETTETKTDETTETPPDEESEVVVTIGDEQTPETDAELEKAPAWVKELRKNHRELQRENRELRQKVEAVSGAGVKDADDPGPKPTLEGCDFDAEKFEKELESWHAKKLAADEKKREKQKEEDAAKAAWQAKLDAYGQAKSKLKVKDADEVEAAVQETLSTTQQGVLLQGADNPALLVYALGKNPKKLKEMAAIKDPVKFAFAVAKLETQLKVTPRKAPPPEKKVTGSAPVSGAVDSTLERLRAEAERTGDYTKVTAYKRDKRAAGKST